MLGTPNAGSWAPMQVLSGDDDFGNTLIAFGAPFQDHSARQMMAQFPGFIQLQADAARRGEGAGPQGNLDAVWRTTTWIGSGSTTGGMPTSAS